MFLCVCVGMGWDGMGWGGGLRASAVVSTGGHTPVLETLQKSHIVKPQSPQIECLHFVSVFFFLLSSTLLSIYDRIYLGSREREREEGDGFLMTLKSKACVVCMVRGFALQCYTWSWLSREVSPGFPPSEV